MQTIKLPNLTAKDKLMNSKKKSKESAVANAFNKVFFPLNNCFYLKSYCFHLFFYFLSFCCNNPRFSITALLNCSHTFPYVFLTCVTAVFRWQQPFFFFYFLKVAFSLILKSPLKLISLQFTSCCSVTVHLPPRQQITTNKIKNQNEQAAH